MELSSHKGLPFPWEYDYEEERWIDDFTRENFDVDCPHLNEWLQSRLSMMLSDGDGKMHDITREDLDELKASMIANALKHE